MNQFSFLEMKRQNDEREPIQHLLHTAVTVRIVGQFCFTQIFASFHLYKGKVGTMKISSFEFPTDDDVQRVLQCTCAGFVTM